MAHETLFVPKQSDKLVINCFRKIAEEYDIASFTVSAFGYSSFEIQSSNYGKPVGILKTLLEEDSNLINIITLTLSGFSLTFKKGGHDEPPSPYFDGIRIRDNDSDLDQINRIKIGATLTKELRAFEPGRTIQGPSEEQNQLQTLHQSMLERLETTATTLIEKLAEYEQRQQSKFLDNEAKRDEEVQKYKEQLYREHEDKDKALEERERELNERIAEVDNRENTHVRRGLRDALLKEIQKRSDEFKLTKGTNKLRLPIHAACITGLLVITYGAIFYANQLTGFISVTEFHTLPFVILTVKQIALTLGAVGLGFFYIRWLNRWFHQHADAEFELKQFQLDIDRASWLVETVLEWKASKDESIPDKLLASLARNLFSGDDREQSEQLKHPADILASALLGTASRAELKVGDSKIEFDGKDLKKQMAP